MDSDGILSPDDVRKKVRSLMRAHGSQTGWCNLHDLNPGEVFRFLRGIQSSPPKRLVRAINVVAITPPNDRVKMQMRAALARLKARETFHG